MKDHVDDWARRRNGAEVRYFDAHNHLQDDALAPHAEAIFERLERLPVEAAVVNGTAEDDWENVAALARRFSWVRPSYGLHPWRVGQRTERWLDALRARLDAADSPTPALLGEIGLDRWILDSARADDPRLAGLRRAPLAEQIDVFSQQLAIGAERNLPTTIHCLEAWGTLAEVMASGAVPARGFLLHAFGGSLETMRSFSSRGAYFSFNGYFLGDRKERQQQVFREVPLDRLLVETDAPSMPLPEAWRAHKLPRAATGAPLNHPCNIEVVYTGLAALRGMSVEALSLSVAANFKRFFDAK